MKVVSSLSEASDALAGRPCVLGIGNFDGLHLGHQAILQSIARRSSEFGLPSVVMTFEPHPIQVIAPEKAPKRINTPEQKLRQICDYGIELLFVVHFDLEFASLSPDAFIRQFLVTGLRARTVCVGNNFAFGHRQAGSVETLRLWHRDFDLHIVPPVMYRGNPVSSTEVRKAVNDGAVSAASRLLGRWYEIEGRIASGAGRGRRLTVPTLNLESDNELVPKHGVYVSRIALDKGTLLDSVTNIGVRPTFGVDGMTIETFVLRDQVPAAAQFGRLQFLHRIRDEKRFDSPELLSSQIARDVGKASRFFRLLGNIEHARAHSH